MLDDAGHGDHVVAANDERPGFTFRPRDLRVDEHVLDLLLPPREAVAGPPSAYLKPFEVGADPPPAPPHLAVERDRPALAPEPVVLPHGLHAAAEIDALRPRLRPEELRECGRQRLAGVEGTEDVLVG